MAWLLPARYTMGVSRNKRWLYTAIVTSYASAPSMAVSRDPSSTYKSSVAWSRDLIQLDREAFTLYTCHVTMAWLIPARYTMGVSRDKRWLYTVIVTRGKNLSRPCGIAMFAIFRDKPRFLSFTATIPRFLCLTATERDFHNFPRQIANLMLLKCPWITWHSKISLEFSLQAPGKLLRKKLTNRYKSWPIVIEVDQSL